MTNKFNPVDPKWIDVEWEDIGIPDEGFFGMLDDGTEEPFAADDWPDDIPLMSLNECYDYLYDVILPTYGTLTPADDNILPYNNQSPESSCVLNAEEAGTRGCRNLLVGWQFEIKTAPMWSYSQICSSRHSGSYTSSAMTLGMETGHVPEKSSAYNVGVHQRRLDLCHARSVALCPHTYHQNTQYPGKRVYQEAKATAKHFKNTVVVNINSKEKYQTALALQRPLFNGRSGHSILQDALVFDDDNRRRPLSRYCDSYGPGRGDNGRLYDSERSWNWNGAYAFFNIERPQNPLFPCGKDTLPVSLEKYYELFPDVDRDYIQQLFDLGPEG